MSDKVSFMDRAGYAWHTGEWFERIGMVLVAIAAPMLFFGGLYLLYLLPALMIFILIIAAFIGVLFLVACGVAHFELAGRTIRRDGPHSYKDFQQRKS
jgi:hypothetical protein